MKFKSGDRVVVTRRRPYATSEFVVDAQGEAGVVYDVDAGIWRGGDIRVYVHMDCAKAESPYFKTWEQELEFEDIYNSPLYQALK